MKQLYFVRHGESTANSGRICAGHIDVALSDLGLNQATVAADKLCAQGVKIDLIVSSPLQRALATAERIAEVIGYPGANIVVCADAIERFRGDFEGKPSVMQRNATDQDYIQHGAESETQMWGRAQQLLRYLAGRSEDSILLVSHGQFGRSFVACATGQQRKNVEKPPNAQVFEVLPLA